MLRLSRKKRTGARAAILAGATAGVLAVAGIGAGSASAALSCTGNNIVGEGSSLQKIAQQSVWAPAFTTSICPGKTVTYNSVGSGAGMKQWNYDGVNGKINTAVQFIGTDDAPTAAQIENITKVTTGGAAALVVVPVAQTAISIVANPPAECTVGKIKNVDLEKVFRGVYLTWSQITTAEGTGCSEPITRVVRKDGSGTTFQLKNYLSKSNVSALPCINKTWVELEPISNGETGAPNTSWPETCPPTKTLSPVVKPAANGGGEEVKKVNATPGGIGYASLPDAKANGAIALLEVQNNGQKTEGVTYAAPEAIGAVANCEKTLYEVPVDARNQLGHTGLNVDWSQVFGGNPGIGGSTYPLCTLTYDLAFHNYKAAGFKFKDEVTVHDYITEFLVKETGQETLEESEKYYGTLPQAEKLKNNVLGSAKFVASLISFE